MVLGFEAYCSSSPLSIHTASSSLGAAGADPSWHRAKAGFTLDRPPVHLRAHIETDNHSCSHSHLRAIYWSSWLYHFFTTASFSFTNSLLQSVWCGPRWGSVSRWTPWNGGGIAGSVEGQSHGHTPRKFTPSGSRPYSRRNQSWAEHRCSLFAKENHSCQRWCHTLFSFIASSNENQTRPKLIFGNNVFDMFICPSANNGGAGLMTRNMLDSLTTQLGLYSFESVLMDGWGQGFPRNLLNHVNSPSVQSLWLKLRFLDIATQGYQIWQPPCD